MEGQGNESNYLIYAKFNPCNGTTSTVIDGVHHTVVENSCALKSIFIIALGVFTVVSNAVLLHLIRTNKTLQTTANLYIVSLAVTDLLVGLLVIPPNISDVCDFTFPWESLPWSHGVWVTADFYLTTESILNYVLFNLDRFWSINAPFKYLRKRSRRKTIMHIAASWGIGVVTVISPAITWNFGFNDLVVPSKTVFVEFKQSAWLMFSNAILIYFIPFSVLCAIYGKIFRALSARSKLGIVTTSTSVFSNKTNGSRRDSGFGTSQPFITECELERLRSIYDRALKRERAERRLRTMFPRRKRRYNTATGGELKRYDSIEEEEDTHEKEDCSSDEPPNGFPKIRRREPIIGYLDEARTINDRDNDSHLATPLRDISGSHGTLQTNESMRGYGSIPNHRELIENEDDLKVSNHCCNSSEKNNADLPPDICRQVRYSCSKDIGSQSHVTETCTNGRPRYLKMARVEQMKRFGGIVCPRCSQMFSRVGLIKPSDLEDDNGVDLSSDIKSFKNDQSSSASIVEADDHGETESDILNETRPKDDLAQITNQKCIHCVDIPLPKKNCAIRRVSLENDLEQPCDTVLHDFPERSRRFSHPALLTAMEPSQHRNSIGDITNRVRQSFQSSFSAISGKSSRALNVIRQQEKAAKQLGITLTCLFVCWTPYFLQIIIYSVQPQSAKISFMTASVYLGYFHSLCNPILIIIFNLKIQRAFTTAICCFPRKKNKSLIVTQPSAL